MESPAIGLVAQRLSFACRATSSLALPEFAGASVRGALFSALRHDVCVHHGAGRIGGDEWSAECPVCALFAPVDATAERGRDIARPFTIEPPLQGEGIHQPGWRFSFGVTLFGHASLLFPYMLVASHTMGRLGFGRRGQAPGRFMVEGCWAEDPLSGRRQRIMNGWNTDLTTPALTLTDQVVAEKVQRMTRSMNSPTRLTVRFLTPTRLINEGHLGTAPHFSLLFRRVIGRLRDLGQSTGTPPPEGNLESLIRMAEQIHLSIDHTRWIDLRSYSKRSGVSSPIGGLVGEATYEGDLCPFLPWLVWGEITHVGKDTTKGNGVFQIAPL